LQTLNRDGSVRGEFNSAGFIETPPESKIVIGCDVGVMGDFTSLTVLDMRRNQVAPEHGGIGSDLVQRLSPPIWVVKDAEQLPLGVRYEAICEHLVAVQRHWTATTGRNVRVAIDATGCRPIIEMARRAGLDVQPCQITAGGPDSVTFDSAGWMNLSKAAMIVAIDSMLTAREVFLEDDSIPGVATLRRELLQMQMTRSQTGAPRWNATGSGHDDFVSALGLAAVVTRHQPSNRVASQPLYL
jgi:hypothetical protein